MRKGVITLWRKKGKIIEVYSSESDFLHIATKVYKRKEGMQMKLTKKLALIALSVSVLSACAQENSPVNQNGSENTVQTPEKKEVKKHESEKLPVTIFSDTDYKIEGQQVGFKRIITKVEMKDFDESSEIEFYDRYGKSVRNEGLNLQEDFKLLMIHMKHETGEARREPLEAFMLNEGSGLVVGDNELSIQNEFLMYQQDYLSTEFKVGTTFDLTGDIMMAIPKENAEDPNLQLRILQQIDEEKKYIYIDLN